MILAVDRNHRNLDLLAKLLESQGYETVTSDTLEEFDRALASLEKIHLALVDIQGFDAGIWERCESLHRSHIPFLIVSSSSQSRPEIQQICHSHGARGVLVKPLSSKDLIGMIRSLLEEA